MNILYPVDLLSSSVQSVSCVRLFVTPWTAACQASLSITNAWSLLKLMSITLVMPSNHFIPCHPLIRPPLIFRISGCFQVSQFFTPGGQGIGSFHFSISPPNGYSGLISFRMDCSTPASCVLLCFLEFAQIHVH